jgi:hypothetical protein
VVHRGDVVDDFFDVTAILGLWLQLDLEKVLERAPT